jgi:hypothetical protein
MGIHTPIGKLMPQVCKQWGMSEPTVRFTFEGQRLQKKETPSVVSKPVSIYEEQVALKQRTY